MSSSVRYRTVPRALALIAGAVLVPAVHAQKPVPAPVPTPESSFGFAVGTDYKLFDYEQSIAYFKRLAASSNRIKLLDVGQTSFGRPFTVAIISSPENLARLDDIRRVNMRLAHPEGLTDSVARQRARRREIGRAHV